MAALFNRNVQNGDVVEGRVVDLSRDKEFRTVLTTLGLLFNSRRFIVLLGTIFVTIIVSLFPELEILEENLVYIVTTAVALIGGLSIEDAANAVSKNRDTTPESLRDQIEELVTIGIDEFLDEAFSNREDASGEVIEDEEQRFAKSGN